LCVSTENGLQINMDFGGHYVGWDEERNARRQQRRAELESSIDVTRPMEEAALEEDEIDRAKHPAEGGGVALEAIPILNVDNVSMFTREAQQALADTFGPWKIEKREGAGVFGEVFRVRKMPEKGWERAMMGSQGRLGVIKTMYEPSAGNARFYAEEVAKYHPDEGFDTNADKIGSARDRMEHEIAATLEMGALQDVRRVEDKRGERKLALLMGYVPGQDMKTIWEAIEAGESVMEIHDARAMGALAFESVARQLIDMRKLGWAHHDIKPANIRVDTALPHRARAVDFGISERTGVPRPTGRYSGTPFFAAPEQYIDVPMEKSLEDMYSLAMCLARGFKLIIRDPKKVELDIQNKIIEIMNGTFHLSAENRESIQEFITQQTGEPLSPAELKLAELAWDVVLPYANALKNERVNAWKSYADGRGMDLTMFAEGLSDCLEDLFAEGGCAYVSREEEESWREEIEQQTKQEATNLVLRAQELWRRYEGERMVDFSARIETLNKNLRTMDTREDAEFVCVLAQHALRQLGEETGLEVSKEIEGEERAEMDHLVEESRALREPDEQPLTAQEQEDLAQLLAEIKSTTNKEADAPEESQRAA